MNLEQIENLQEFDSFLLNKKKKKKKVKIQYEIESENQMPTYIEMLERIYHKIGKKNLLDKKVKLPPPETIIRNKKTIWTNFNKICDLLNRNKDHVMSFFSTELGIQTSIDGNNNFLMRGRFQSKQIENLVTRYINEYVICKMCHSIDTLLTRDSITKLYFLNCSNCNSQRSVVPIRIGFHAISKADRKKLI
jgi:translation initiation factor 2 subunit 2